jgi:hypothetical protein
MGPSRLPTRLQCSRAESSSEAAGGADAAGIGRSALGLASSDNTGRGSTPPLDLAIPGSRSVVGDASSSISTFAGSGSVSLRKINILPLLDRAPERVSIDPGDGAPTASSSSASQSSPRILATAHAASRWLSGNLCVSARHNPPDARRSGVVTAASSPSPHASPRALLIASPCRSVRATDRRACGPVPKRIASLRFSGSSAGGGSPG